MASSLLFEPLVPSGSGTLAFDQCEPFQCSSSLSTVSGPGVVVDPDAQQLLAEGQESPVSWLASPAAVPAGLGTASLLHFLPFQCSTWLWSRRVVPSRP